MKKSDLRPGCLKEEEEEEEEEEDNSTQKSSDICVHVHLPLDRVTPLDE